jgi:hypothetical protein
MTEEKQKPQFPIYDNPTVAETYANKFLGPLFDGSTVMLTFGTTRWTPPPPEQTMRIVKGSFTLLT